MDALPPLRKLRRFVSAPVVNIIPPRSLSSRRLIRSKIDHGIVLQLDRSRVPGQVAGDALLCRTVCVGGDGAIERIAFPKTCGKGRTIDQIASTALDLLKNANARTAFVAESQQHALERLSFQAV